MINKNMFFSSLILILTSLSYFSAAVAEDVFHFQSETSVIRYIVRVSGDNYNFEFDTHPGNSDEQLKAGVHVLRSIYQDSSINLGNREGYIRERAKCSFFKARFYDYTFCVFPDDFSVEKQNRFRGFVTQMPNWKWIVVWNLLPAIVVFTGIFWFNRKGKKV